jgi:hypothetical protein
VTQDERRSVNRKDDAHYKDDAQDDEQSVYECGCDGTAETTAVVTHKRSLMTRKLVWGMGVSPLPRPRANHND